MKMFTIAHRDKKLKNDFDNVKKDMTSKIGIETSNYKALKVLTSLYLDKPPKIKKNNKRREIKIKW